MAFHTINPERQTLHGYFSRDLAPVLTIEPGDVVRFQTIDAAWNLLEQEKVFGQDFEKLAKFTPRDPEKDKGHALCGPLFVRGAEAGMTLEVRLLTIRTGKWGWSYFSVGDKMHGLYWSLDPYTGIATSAQGHCIQMNPFCGVMGMPPDEPGIHETRPPRIFGGNMDCRELVVGSRLYLPIAVTGALFSLGDGHAVQGDGEVSGVAIECGMEQVDVEIHLHRDIKIKAPRAYTPAGWLTLGFDEDLDRAQEKALEGMADLMGELYGFDRLESINLASLVVQMRITQVVNGVKGVHALLPHHAIHMQK